MLRPLDPQRLDALARGDGDDEGVEFHLHHHMENIRKDIKEGGNWGIGVLGVLQEGGDFVTTIQRTRSLSYEERKGSDEWYIDFYVRAVDRAYGSAITDPLSRTFHSKT